jgi:hypothetical protein
MPTKAGPKDSNIDSLVFGYNMADLDQSYDGYPVSNSVASTTTLSRYNNPGFSGYNRKTNRIHPVTNTPIWELAFYPQDEGRVPRLTSSEGYGCVHGMGRELYSGTVYMASILMKEGPGTRFIDNSKHHGYSNIGGWTVNGTSQTKEYVGNGWWRFYTLWNNQTTAYSADGVTPLATRYSGNSYSTHDLTAGEHIVSGDINPYAYIPGGTSNFRGNYSFAPYIINDYDSVGAQFLDWGLDPEMTKPVFDPVFNYPDSSNNIRFFFKVNMPAPGSIRIRNRAYGVCRYLTDSKYWKIRFSDTALNKRELMWVTAPMIHEVPSTSYKKPWVYVDGNRDGGLRDLVSGAEMNLLGVSKNATEEGFYFDGTDDLISITNPDVHSLTGDVTLSSWFKWDDSAYAPHRTLICTSASYRAGVKLMAYYHGNMACWIGNNDGTDSYLVAGGAPPADEWHMLTCTRSTSGVVKLYLDGVEIANVDTGITGNLHTVNNPQIGSEYHSRYMGQLDMGRVYDTVLTDDEILALYNSTKSRFQ